MSKPTIKSLLLRAVLIGVISIGLYTAYQTGTNGLPFLQVANAAGTLTVSTPGAGSTVTSPVSIKATLNGVTAKYMKVWVDGVSNTNSIVHINTLNTSITMSRGAHTISVEAGDAAGVIYKKIL